MGQYQLFDAFTGKLIRTCRSRSSLDRLINEQVTVHRPQSTQASPMDASFSLGKTMDFEPFVLEANTGNTFSHYFTMFHIQEEEEELEEAENNDDDENRVIFDVTLTFFLYSSQSLRELLAVNKNNNNNNNNNRSSISSSWLLPIDSITLENVNENNGDDSGEDSDFEDEEEDDGDDDGDDVLDEEHDGTVTAAKDNNSAINDTETQRKLLSKKVHILLETVVRQLALQTLVKNIDLSSTEYRNKSDRLIRTFDGIQDKLSKLSGSSSPPYTAHAIIRDLNQVLCLHPLDSDANVKTLLDLLNRECHGGDALGEQTLLERAFSTIGERVTFLTHLKPVSQSVVNGLLAVIQQTVPRSVGDVASINNDFASLCKMVKQLDSSSSSVPSENDVASLTMRLDFLWLQYSQFYAQKTVKLPDAISTVLSAYFKLTPLNTRLQMKMVDQVYEQSLRLVTQDAELAAFYDSETKREIQRQVQFQRTIDRKVAKFYRLLSMLIDEENGKRSRFLRLLQERWSDYGPQHRFYTIFAQLSLSEEDSLIELPPVEHVLNIDRHPMLPSMNEDDVSFSSDDEEDDSSDDDDGDKGKTTEKKQEPTPTPTPTPQQEPLPEPSKPTPQPQLPQQPQNDFFQREYIKLVQSLNEEKERSLKRERELEAFMTKEREEYESTIEEYTKKNSALSLSQQNLKEELAKKVETVAQSESKLEKLRHQTMELSRRIQSESEKMKKTMEEKDKTIEEWKQQVESAERELKELSESQREQLQLKDQEVEHLKQANTTLVATNRELQQKVELLQKHLSTGEDSQLKNQQQLEMQLLASRQENDKLKQQLQQQQLEMQSLRVQVSNMNAAYHNSKVELDQSNRKYQSACQQLQQMSHDNHMLQQEVRSVRQTSQDMSSQLSTMTEMNNDRQNTIAQLTGENTTLRQANDSLRQAIEALERRLNLAETHAIDSSVTDALNELERELRELIEKTTSDDTALQAQEETMDKLTYNVECIRIYSRAVTNICNRLFEACKPMNNDLFEHVSGAITEYMGVLDSGMDTILEQGASQEGHGEQHVEQPDQLADIDNNVCRIKLSNIQPADAVMLLKTRAAGIYRAVTSKDETRQYFAELDSKDDYVIATVLLVEDCEGSDPLGIRQDLPRIRNYQALHVVAM